MRALAFGLVLALLWVAPAFAEQPDVESWLADVRSHDAGTYVAPDRALSLRDVGTAAGRTTCQPARQACRPSRGLHWDISVIGWLTGVDGNVSARGIGADVEVTPIDVIDILENVEFAIAWRVRAVFADWMAFCQGMTFDVSESLESRAIGRNGFRAEAEASIGATYSQVALGYRVASCLRGRDCYGRERRTSLYAYAGVRYFELRGEVEPRELRRVEQSRQMFDPVVGLLFQWDLGRRWRAEFEADVGGFSVGSRISSYLRGSIAYQFSRTFYAEVGYAALYVDYIDDGFVWDVTMYGPYVSVGVVF